MTEFPPPPPDEPEAEPVARPRQGRRAGGSPAGWAQRAGATIVDGLLFLVPNFVILQLAGQVEAGIISTALFAVYLVVLLGRSGQSVGNRAAGTLVVEEGGRPVNYWRAVVRWASQFVLGVPVLVAVLAGGPLLVLALIPLLDYLWPLWDRRNQTLHDKMAGTYVLIA